MSSSDDTSGRRRRAAFIAGSGIVLLVLGIIGVILYATGAPDAAAEAGTETGALRGATVWAAALAMGIGAALILTAIVVSRRGGSQVSEVQGVGRPKGDVIDDQR
jgi:hypothetical protein